MYIFTGYWILLIGFLVGFCVVVIVVYCFLYWSQRFWFLCLFSTGLQVLLPDYLQECFVQAALSYIACNSEGEFICKDNDCWCQCGPRFPECNCPSMDIQAVEENLLRVSETWEVYNSNFEESGKAHVLMEHFQTLINKCLKDFAFQEESTIHLEGLFNYSFRWTYIALMTGLSEFC